MENKNILNIAIVLTVGVILAGSLLMPVISDATATEKTFTNEGFYYMTDTTSEHTYVFDGSKWTVDGEVLNHTLAGVNIIATDTFFIRDIGQVRGAYNISGITACNLTVTDGALTGTYTQASDPVTVDWSFNTFYGATNDKTGYILSKNTLSPIAYVKGDSDVFGYGLTNLGSNQALFQLTGNKTDGITVTCPNSAVTISNVTFNATPVDGYIDLYEFVSVTFTATLNDTDYPVTYNIIVLPSEVTAELSNHFNNGEIALINTIPVMVIVALLMVAVGGLYLRRND